MGPPGCADYASRWLRRKMPLGKARERRKTPTLVCNHPIALEELCEAEKSVIKRLQDNAFEGEIKMIQDRVIGGRELEQITISSVKQRNHFVKGTSNLRGLDPFLDKDGILRVGRKIRQASIQFEFKHSVILPKRSHVTELIIRRCHYRFQQQGLGVTLNGL